jgi:hypothetical protein
MSDLVRVKRDRPGKSPEWFAGWEGGGYTWSTKKQDAERLTRERAEFVVANNRGARLVIPAEPRHD